MLAKSAQANSQDQSKNINKPLCYQHCRKSSNYYCRENYNNT